MAQYTSLGELKEAVVANGDVLTLPMEALRDAYGAKRAGRIVREDLAKKLAGVGLGHFPDQLPTYQHELVRLYTLGSRIHDLINAVSGPSEDNDEVLKEAAGGEEAEVLRQVRALVCTS
jgi:hypothetical protein